MKWQEQFERTVSLLKPYMNDKGEDSFYRDSLKKLVMMPEEAKEVRFLAMDNFFTFCRLVNPGYVYGDIHKEACDWMQDYTLFGQGKSRASNKLLMFPRAHLKSHLVANWCAWMITRHPEITILYLSATAELSEIQLYAIKATLSSDTYTRYWPEYVNPMEGRRTKWTERKIIIDHVIRKTEGIRDATVSTAGLTTNTTGWHADIIVPDDLVVPENAYTEEGRRSVSKKSSQFTSIRNAGGFTMACGTRYHPSDIYDTWKNQSYDEYDDEGILVERKKVWDIMERVVESNGVFLWPRTVRADGKAFGFNRNELARIKAEYSDVTQFYAQYYNNPNSPGSERINRECFQYYDSRHLKHDGYGWLFKDRKLNIYAAIDFAYSTKKGADYTAIVVIGIDCEGDVYVLDIERFKTDRSIDYYRKISEMHSKWDFSKLRAEVTAAQQIIVNDIKEHVRKDGLKLKVEDHRPTAKKEERIAAVLEYRYENLSMWHFKGGYTPALEDELVLANPPHDDLKDALAAAVEIAIKPKQSVKKKSNLKFAATKSNRFGGVPYR